MMINQNNTLGYDPCDMNDYPYKASGFGRGDFALSPRVLEEAPDLDIKSFFLTLTNDPYFDGSNGYRTIDMAARLFQVICTDPAFNDIARADMLAACFDQAMEWEVG